MSDPATQRPTRVRWWIFALAFATSWLLYLHRYAWGVIKPDLMAEDPDLDPVRVGWLDGCFSLTYALGQVPGGLLGDAFGPRRILPALIFLWSGCVGWTALVRGFWPLAGVRAAFGLAQAGAYPILTQVTRRWFPLSVRTTVQGAVASLAGRAGAACAPLVVATLLMGLGGLSWRAALLALSGLGAVLAFAVLVVCRAGPHEHPWTNPAERELIGDVAPAAGARARLRLSGRTRLTLGALLLYAFASTFADQLYVFWIPQFLVEGRDLSRGEMGVFAGLPPLGGAVGGFLGGSLNDWLIRRTGSRRLGRSAVAFTGKFLAAVLVTASLLVADGRWAMAVLFACKFFGDWGLPTVWGTITDISGRAAGTVFGAVNMAGAVAAFLAGPAMGWLRQTQGWEGLFLTVGAAYLAAACCWLVIDCTCRLWEE
jgi:MFS transporter, ACS family, glucarate transporter